MNNSNLSSTVSSAPTILRYFHNMCEQNVRLKIQAENSKDSKIFHSNILKIDEEKQQVILHQILPNDWKNELQENSQFHLSCHMNEGIIDFSAQLSPLDDDDNTLYSVLDLPKQITKKQLRAFFRVSLSKYQSRTSITLGTSEEISGTCKDLSLTGALIHIPKGSNHIERGKVVKHCRLNIDNILELSCPARVCHVTQTKNDDMLVGLNFIDPGYSYFDTIRPAMNKIERQNITQNPM